jgi:hypothetical protein
MDYDASLSEVQALIGSLFHQLRPLGRICPCPLSGSDTTTYFSKAFPLPHLE